MIVQTQFRRFPRNETVGRLAVSITDLNCSNTDFACSPTARGQLRACPLLGMCNTQILGAHLRQVSLPNVTTSSTIALNHIVQLGHDHICGIAKCSKSAVIEPEC